MNYEPKFNMGDRVYARCDNPSDNKSIRTGDTGTVIVVHQFRLDHDKDQIGVRWDSEIIDGHSLRGKCDMGHGWYVYADKLEIIPEPEHEDFEPATDEELMRFLYDKEA